MKYQQLKQRSSEVVSGAKLAYRNSARVMCIALVVVVGVQEWGASVVDYGKNRDLARVIEYTQAPTAKDIAEGELNRYVDAVALEIFDARLPVYHEQARQEAIQSVGNQLVELTDVSPHVDYIHMREVVSMIE